MFGQKKAVETQTVYKVVELPKRSTPPEDARALQESIATLSSHPGFVELLNRLELQNAALKSKLSNERHKDIRDVEFIQSGIFWSDWLKNQLKLATVKYNTRTFDATQEELEAFKEIDSQIERIGTPNG